MLRYVLFSQGGWTDVVSLIIMASMITLFFTIVALFFKLKYVLSLYVIGNILVFFILDWVLHPLQSSYMFIYSQLPALILSAIGIYISHKFQPHVLNKVKRMQLKLFCSSKE